MRMRWNEGLPRSSRGLTALVEGGREMGVKSPLIQRALAGITVILVLAALSMIWPVIMTLFLGHSRYSNCAAPNRP